MALVFQAVADETERGDQTGLFIFGGWLAPVLDWQDKITPLWEERVLNGRPTLPYLHVAELLSREGRAKYGITKKQAEARIEKAITVIRRAPKGLAVAVTHFDGGSFRDVFKGGKVVRLGKQHGVYSFEPDYIGFMGFAIGALDFIGQRYPEAKQVDFLIEKKPPVTHRMEEFFQSLPDALAKSGRAHLIPLVGEFIPGDKKRVPCQIADLLLWHARTVKSNECRPIDRRRFHRIAEGREGVANTLTRVDMIALDAKWAARKLPSPFPPKSKRETG